MSIDIVYYNSARLPEFEQKVGTYSDLTTAFGDDRRSFLIALSEAVSRSDVIIAIGAITNLSATLAKGLGMPLTPVDWNAIGIAGEDGVALPQGALPLIVDGSVYGMIIESASQCIIAIDDDPTAVEHLTDTYILTYLAAVCKAAEPISEEDISEPDSKLETVEPEADSADDFPCIQPVEHFDEDAEDYEDDTPDLFADIEDDDFLVIDERRRGKGWLVALIIVSVIIVLGAVGGYFGYTMWWIPRQYDETVTAAKAKYESGNLEIGSIPAEYALRFGELYIANNDIIGWISAEGVDIDSPIVTSAGLQANYYNDHLYDGTANKYGTPHIKYAYDTVTNVNPNLVVYGNNFGDSRALSDVEKLLDKSVAENVTLHTDSVFYGEDSWRVFSVMVLDENSTEFDYTDNFATLTAAKRAERVVNAIALSKVSLGVTAGDFANVGLNDTFLTLVTPSCTEKGKVVVAMAMRIKTADEIYAPTIGDDLSDVSDDTASDESSDAMSSGDTSSL